MPLFYSGLLSVHQVNCDKTEEKFVKIFTARHEFCLSVRPSVCLFLCPSDKRVDCDKTEEKSVQIFYTIIHHHLA